MPYIAICSKEPSHAVKGQVKEIDGADCQASGCDGHYEVIRYAGTGAPRPYSGVSATVRRGAHRLHVKARPLSTRTLRKDNIDALDATRRRKRDEQLARLRRMGADTPLDVSDTGDYIGENAPFKGVYTRLSVGGRYAPRPNLTAIMNAAKPHKIKMKHVAVGPAVPRGSGQTTAMGNRSAATASSRNLPKTQISRGAQGSQSAPYSEEWCHLQAASLGGSTVPGNLVAASYACNTYMMAIESYVQNRTELELTISAYCTGSSTEVAEAIRYKIYVVNGNSRHEVFRVVIDATAQHFSREDLDDLKRELRQKVPAQSVW